MKQKFRSLPAAVQVAVTAVVVVVLAVVLTVWRHNGSTYLTGFWDNGSQTLVFGRMLQMQQNQTSPGGFMGVYTQDWSDEQNRYWYRDNTPVSPQDFQAYTHQTGLQGWAFGVLNKVLSVFEDRGEARENTLYNINSMLFYAATLLVCLAVWRAWGPLSALAWLCAVVFAPLAAARHERPVLVPVDLVAARFGGAAALCRYPAARQNALVVLPAGVRRLHGALHVRV